jgi:SAM-dependent methyltransferase
VSLKHCIPQPARVWLYWRRAKALAVVKKAGHRLGLGKFIWKTALPSEIKFWEDYLVSRGKSCNVEQEFAFRTSPDSELQPWLREWIEPPAGSTLRILDVGAGPLTWVGKKCDQYTIQIDAIDPLADVYNQIIDRNGITPPVRTKKGDGEDIVAQFGREVFDMTFARNCLDHAYDAIKAVTGMVEVTRPGGVLCLWHNQDEAERLSYQGLHQWNFRLEKDTLLVWKGEKRLNVNQTFSKQLKVLQLELKNDMIQAIYRKL